MMLQPLNPMDFIMRLSIPHSLRLPRICLICEMTYQNQYPICPACTQNLPYLNHYCLSCGYKIDEKHQYCQSCTHQGSVIHEFNAPLIYQEPIKHLLQLFKFHQGFDLCSFFAELMMQNLSLSCLASECLIPVPLHNKKLFQRGFHQTWLLAKHLSRRLKIPVSLNYCKKIKNTSSQASLDKKNRKSNLKHSFSYTKPPYSHITLIDDVHTTGTTLNLIAQGFSDLGVEKIDAWVIAKA